MRSVSVVRIPAPNTTKKGNDFKNMYMGTVANPVNYPALTDGALGFPVAFTTHLHLPFGVFTYPRPVPLIEARAMLIDAFKSRLYTIPHLGQ